MGFSVLLCLYMYGGWYGWLHLCCTKRDQGDGGRYQYCNGQFSRRVVSSAKSSDLVPQLFKQMMSQFRASRPTSELPQVSSTWN
jgi:hypothetical protein